MKTSRPSARMRHTRTSKKARRLKIAGWLAMVVFSIGIACAAGAQDSFLFTAEDDRVRGDRHALLTLLEYSDFTCGFCEKFFKETWPILFSEYIQSGKVRLVYRDFPRAISGPSVDTALAARCAGEQGHYWAMHDRLFSSSKKFSQTDLQQQAEALQLNVRQFTSCFDASKYTKDIFEDRIEAGQYGIRGTPFFILYVTDHPQEAVAIPGAFPYEFFKEEIDKLLQKAASPRVSSDSL